MSLYTSKKDSGIRQLLSSCDSSKQSSQSTKVKILGQPDISVRLSPSHKKTVNQIEFGSIRFMGKLKVDWLYTDLGK